MESFLVAARVVVPMAIMMGLGILLRVLKVTDRQTMKNVDRITYWVFMPTLMFYNIYTTDFSDMKNLGFIAFGVIGLAVLMIAAIYLVPLVIREPKEYAAIGQAILRPNYILFGCAVANSIYGSGNIGIVMLMGAIAVPAFNAMSAIVLEAGRCGRSNIGKLMRAILKNPMVIAAALGIGVNLLGIRFPDMISGVVKDVADLTTPISFLSMGVSLSLGAMTQKRKQLLFGIVCRMAVVPLIFMPLALALGFRGQELCAIMILFAAPTAVSSYPMAVAMGADGDLAGQMVATTTVLSLVTIFLWTLVLSSAQFL